MTYLFTDFRRIEDVNAKGWGTTFTLNIPVDARPHVSNESMGAA
jgi:hypothetical protein